jgi:hypothetical protein
MFYGLDIHSKQISICLLNETGQVVHCTQVRAINQMMRVLQGLPDRFEDRYEARCGHANYQVSKARPTTRRISVATPTALPSPVWYKIRRRWLPRARISASSVS